VRETYIGGRIRPVVRQKLTDAGAEVLQSTPQELSDYRRKEAAKWVDAIKRANMVLD
jgi:hypothetical protein